MIARIDRRFRGPPDSGNGGYVCGILAKALGGSDCRVTLLQPPPLDRDLSLEADGATARLLDGETLIATAECATVELEIPPPPSLAEAEAASRGFTGYATHMFPGCFVCGPDRVEGDGLRIFAGAASGQVAAVWTPDASLIDEHDKLDTEFVWAALDCPGYFAVEPLARLAVLGRFAVSIRAPAAGGQPLIVTGWPIASAGRKHRAGTALHDVHGRLLAVGDATWITLRP